MFLGLGLFFPGLLGALYREATPSPIASDQLELPECGVYNQLVWLAIREASCCQPTGGDLPIGTGSVETGEAQRTAPPEGWRRT